MLKLLFVIVVLFPVSAIAATDSSCELIKNVDARNACRAQTGQNASYCEMIKDGDSRNLCRAKVAQKPSYCGLIKDADKRNYCRALSK